VFVCGQGERSQIVTNAGISHGAHIHPQSSETHSSHVATDSVIPRDHAAESSQPAAESAGDQEVSAVDTPSSQNSIDTEPAHTPAHGVKMNPPETQKEEDTVTRPSQSDINAVNVENQAAVDSGEEKKEALSAVDESDLDKDHESSQHAAVDSDEENEQAVLAVDEPVLDHDESNPHPSDDHPELDTASMNSHSGGSTDEPIHVDEPVLDNDHEVSPHPSDDHSELDTASVDSELEIKPVDSGSTDEPPHIDEPVLDNDREASQHASDDHHELDTKPVDSHSDTDKPPNVDEPALDNDRKTSDDHHELDAKPMSDDSTDKPVQVGEPADEAEAVQVPESNDEHDHYQTVSDAKQSRSDDAATTATAADDDDDARDDDVDDIDDDTDEHTEEQSDESKLRTAELATDENDSQQDDIHANKLLDEPDDSSDKQTVRDTSEHDAELDDSRQDDVDTDKILVEPDDAGDKQPVSDIKVPSNKADSDILTIGEFKTEQLKPRASVHDADEDSSQHDDVDMDKLLVSPEDSANKQTASESIKVPSNRADSEGVTDDQVTAAGDKGAAGGFLANLWAAIDASLITCIHTVSSEM